MSVVPRTVAGERGPELRGAELAGVPRDGVEGDDAEQALDLRLVDDRVARLISHNAAAAPWLSTAPSPHARVAGIHAPRGGRSRLSSR